MKLKVAIIGCGKVAQLHAAALSGISNAELTAACDTDLSRAEALGVAAFDNPGQMLERAKPDVAIVCTPHPLHARGAVAAAEAGVHVLVEKPLASTVADCDAIIEAARRGGVRLGVVSQRRFFRPVRRMKRAIDAGRIGVPVLGTVAMYSWRDEAYYRSDPWRGRWDTEGGGVLINQSPHHIDLLLWLMGPVEEVIGRWANLNHPYVEVEDAAAAILRFRSGGLGTITVSLCQKPGIYTKVHVHGSNGASVGAQTDTGATFVAGMSGVADAPFNDVWTIPGQEHMLDEFRREDEQAFAALDATVHYHRLQHQEFFDAVVEGRQPAVTGEDGRKVVEVIEAIYKSGGRP